MLAACALTQDAGSQPHWPAPFVSLLPDLEVKALYFHGPTLHWTARDGPGSCAG